MADYIEREVAIGAILGEPTESHYPSWYADKIKEIQTADVAPVRHGKWIETQVETGDPFGGENYYAIDVYACSECGEMFDISEARNYCPNCGVKMDLEMMHNG